MVEAIVGQTYMAVLVARLVGLYTGQQLARSDNGPGDTT
jgi:hypothetical protein